VPEAVKPLAVQEVAPVEAQVSVDELPLVIEVGEAVSVTVGAGLTAVTVMVTDWLAVPPAPVQLKV